MSAGLARVAAIGLLLAACSATSHIKDKLAAILPSGADMEITQTCSGKIFPHAAAFTVSEDLSDAAVLGFEGDGLWMRASSFKDFIARDTSPPKGPGVAATLLDGKSCLRSFSDRAGVILFEESSGLYYRSATGGLVAVLFDEPKGQGVVFLQGR